MEDPFLLDQNRVESQLESVRQQLQRWRQLRDSDHQTGNPEDQEEAEEEFHCLAAELAQGVKSIGWDLDDLQETHRLMLDAKAPRASVDRDSRLSFVAKSRNFLDEVAREVAMTTGKGDARSPSNGRGGGVEATDDDAGVVEAKADRPLLSWRKDTDQVSFPSVELNSLMDLRKARFHNRDWTGLVYRYRYLLAMVAVVCLIVFLTVVALAAKHTVARAHLMRHAGRTSTPPPLARPPECKHFWCRSG